MEQAAYQRAASRLAGGSVQFCTPRWFKTARRLADVHQSEVAALTIARGKRTGEIQM